MAEVTRIGGQVTVVGLRNLEYRDFCSILRQVSELEGADHFVFPELGENMTSLELNQRGIWQLLWKRVAPSGTIGDVPRSA